MLGRTMAPLRLCGVAQEGPPLPPAVQGLGAEGESAPRSHEAADVQAPGRLEVIDHPVLAGHGGELPEDVGAMRRAVLTGACWAQMPPHLPSRHDQGGAPDTHPMADGLLRTFLGLARLSQWGGMWALEHLHARLLVHTDDPASLLGEAPGRHREGTDVTGLGVDRRRRAMEPGDAPMRWEVGLVEYPPEGGAAHRPGPGVVAEDCRHVSPAPSRRWAVVGRRGTRRERQDVEAL